MSTRLPAKSEAELVAWPMVDVIVAVRNEARLITAKLRELDAIDYPAHCLHYVLVDGGSSDGTIAAITGHAAKDARWLSICAGVASKSAQLNEAIGRSQAPWILVTDADAQVPRDTLRRLVAEAARDPRIGVVGTLVAPFQPHPLDASHWRISNCIRRLEARAGGTSGLVVATCYLFRRDLLDWFPDDVLADDVHVVCRAAGQGARTALVETVVTELRVAGTTWAWFRHKVARTIGYLREIFRFAPAILGMVTPMRTILLWRTLALTLFPIAGVAAAILVGVWLGPVAIAGAGAGAVAVTAGAATVSRRAAVPAVAVAATLPVWLLLVTLTALVLYPFVRPGVSSVRPMLRTGRSEAPS